MRRRALSLLIALAASPAMSLSGLADTMRTPVVRMPAGTELSSSTVFEATIPLNAIDPYRWTDGQRKDLAYFAERMKGDDRLFLLIQAVLDPVGVASENEALGLRIGQAVAGRLRESGIPADRMVIATPAKDAAYFAGSRWGPVGAHQWIVIRAIQGGGWLKRKEIPVAVRKDIPPPGSVAIETPGGGRTDRGQHRLRGTIDPSAASVSVVIGNETRTVAVYGGTFDLPISLRKGDNRIVVTGLDAYGRALRASREVRYDPPRPTIDLASPASDAEADLTRSPVIVVRGSIRSRNPVASAYLVQNGIPRNIHVRETGAFEQQAVVVTDEDVFSVEAVDAAGETGVSEERRVKAVGIAERPLLAILHWDEDDVDLDLHVEDGKGHRTAFDASAPEESADAIPWGRLWLDNRKGFGPEVFSIETNANEKFSFSVRYYRGRKACRAYLTVVLYAGSPSRRRVRVLGPIVLSPGKAEARIAEVRMPAGTLRDLSDAARKENR